MPRPGLAPRLRGPATSPASDRETSPPSELFAIWRPSASTQGSSSILAVIVDILLLAALFGFLLCGAWEYSTERYVKGFADAIIPASASGEEQVEAILRWMSQGPRRESDSDASLPDRDPTYTLNYTRLLKACGSATNAFLNLADSGGLRTRRLLLLDSRGQTVHVVAEVLLDGRWIVVDPAFRRILRTPSGMMLTNQDLADPHILSAATGQIPGYSNGYNYANTEHIRVAKLGVLGRLLGRVLSRIIPGWDKSPAASLVVERRSLAALCASAALLLFFALCRGLVTWRNRHGRRPAIH